MVAHPPYRQPLLFQRHERRTPYSFSRVLDEARAVWFPELDVDLEARIDALGPLAGIWYHRMGIDRHIVAFHPVLNRPDVPLDVVRFIAKHELTHIAVPEPGHSRRFWEKELEVAPERFAAWNWMGKNLGHAFAHNRYGLWVRRDWRRRLPARLAPYMPHLPFDDPPFATLCPDGGAQLRFETTWSAGPAPFTSASQQPASTY